MRLAAIYNVFDGDELLPYSVGSIANSVDHFFMVCQTVGNGGDEYQGGIEAVQSLQRQFGNITILNPPAGLRRRRGDNERDRRNAGLAAAREVGYTHALFADCDEVYDSDQFDAALAKLADSDAACSACRLYTYVNLPTLRLEPMEPYWCPWVFRILPETRAARWSHCYADCTRGVVPNAPCLMFDPAELVMHHFSYVRRDLRLKMNNSSARDNMGDLQAREALVRSCLRAGPCHLYRGHSLVEVQNQFSINL